MNKTYNASTIEVDAFAGTVNFCGFLSVIGSILVLFVLVFYHRKSQFIDKCLAHLSFACIGYSLFWIFPRYSTSSIVSTDFGGSPDQCYDDDTLCFRSFAYTEAMMQTFAWASLFQETLILLASIRSILSKPEPSKKMQALALWSIWILCLILGISQLVYCVSVPDHKRRLVAIRLNRFMAFVQTLIITCITILAVVFYFLRIRPILSTIYTNTIGDPERFHMLPDEWQVNKAKLLNARMRDFRSKAAVVLHYPFAFVVMSAPSLIYVVFDTIELLHFSGKDVSHLPMTQAEYFIKNVCFVVLALRGLISLAALFFSHPDNRHMIRCSTIKRRWKQRKRLRRKHIDHVGFASQNTYIEPEVMVDSDDDDDSSTMLLQPESRTHYDGVNDGDAENEHTSAESTDTEPVYFPKLSIN